MSDCIACFKLLPNDGRFMTCADCCNGYHLHGCSGIADSTFNTMGPAKREKWRCRTCRTKESRSSADGAGAASQCDSTAFSSQLAAVNRKLDLLSSLKENVDTLLQLPTKVDELLLLKPSVEKMKETVKEVQESISFFSEKYDSLLALVTAHEREVKTLQSDVVALQSTVSEQAAVIDRLKSDINEAEQYSRLSNLEIHGHPCRDGERLLEFLINLAEKLDVNVEPSEVMAIHRLPSKQTAAAPISVRFASVAAKDRFMNARKRLHALSRENQGTKLYFNDNLSRDNRELFWLARARGKEKKYQFVWVRNAKIFAKKGEGSLLLRINHVKDLEKII